MIQPWTPQYADGAIAVVKAVFDEYNFTWDEHDYHADLYDVPKHYLAHSFPFYVAVVEGKVIGTVALELFPTIPGEMAAAVEVGGKKRIAGADCSLERLYVHPEARRMGAGGTLIDYVVNEAKKRGRHAMEIWSDKRYQDAHRLYKRFGAIQVADRICDDPDLSPEWGLIVNL